MTIKYGMILLGALLIYAGWKNLDTKSLIFGDNTVPKKQVAPTSSPVSAASGGTAGGTSPPPAGTVLGPPVPSSATGQAARNQTAQ